jgi:hypothetical protein
MAHTRISRDLVMGIVPGLLRQAKLRRQRARGMSTRKIILASLVSGVVTGIGGVMYALSKVYALGKTRKVRRK